MRMRAWLVLFVLGCGGGKPAPQQPPTGSAPPDAAVTQCEGPAPSPDHKCVQDCGPPVVRETDPPPAWHWLSPDEVKNREQFGCPRCLPPDTLIATPTGDRPISSLTPGARVFTVDEAGRRVEATIIYVNATPISGVHHVVRVTLADGRVVTGSPGHPDGAGRPLGALHVGELVDGSAVISAEVVPFAGDKTWDLLPSGNTGLYVADGVVLRSTFFKLR
jgi:hypothetical protein